MRYTPRGSCTGRITWGEKCCQHSTETEIFSWTGSRVLGCQSDCNNGLVSLSPDFFHSVLHIKGAIIQKLINLTWSKTDPVCYTQRWQSVRKFSTIAFPQKFIFIFFNASPLALDTNASASTPISSRQVSFLWFELELYNVSTTERGTQPKSKKKQKYRKYSCVNSWGLILPPQSSH